MEDIERNRGYIRMWRRLDEHWIHQDRDPWYFRAWFDLIKEAEWRNVKRKIGNQIFELRRGELVASSRFLAEVLRCSRTRAENFIKLLKSDHMVDHRNVNGTRVLVILNYDKWQSREPEDGPEEDHQVDQGRTTGGPPEDHQVDQTEETKKPRNQEAKKEPPQTPPGASGESDGVPTPEEWVAKWNRYAKSHPQLKQVRTLSKERRAKLITRLRSPGWWKVCKEAVNMLPLPVKGDSSWQPGIDWLVANDTNAARLAEGEFDWRWGDDSKLAKLRRKQAARESEETEATEKAKRKQRYQELQADQQHRNELGKVFQAIAESDGS